MTNHKSPMTNDKSMAQLSRVHPSAEGVVPPPTSYLHFVGVLFQKPKDVEHNAFLGHHMRDDGGMTH
jgi:hypothetical protein